MLNNITFAELEQLLLGLGFVSQPAQGTHRVFLYPALGTLVVLPGYNKNDWVHPAHLVSVRKILAENELMSAKTFDTLSNASKVSA
jgi:predicted RNA binding protein YcfA (HicA-like mRNA interferase family)